MTPLGAAVLPARIAQARRGKRRVGSLSAVAAAAVLARSVAADGGNELILPTTVHDAGVPHAALAARPCAGTAPDSCRLFAATTSGPRAWAADRGVGRSLSCCPPATRSPWLSNAGRERVSGTACGRRRIRRRRPPVLAGADTVLSPPVNSATIVSPTSLPESLLEATASASPSKASRAARRRECHRRAPGARRFVAGDGSDKWC